MDALWRLSWNIQSKMDDLGLLPFNGLKTVEMPRDNRCARCHMVSFQDAC